MNSLDVVFISDTHGQHRRLNLSAGDILIHGGDYSCVGTLKELEDFVDWLNSLNFKYKIFIAGNHDAAFAEHPKRALNLVSNFGEGLIYLQDEEVVLPEGITIYGTPWSCKFLNWNFMEVDESPQMHAHMRKIKKCDILVSHGPAYGVLDRVARDRKSVGSKSLKTIVELLQPRYLLTGHIHEAFSSQPEFIGKTECWNGSQLNEKYQLTNFPISFTIESEGEK